MAKPKTAAEARKFALIFFAYPYSVCALIGILVFIGCNWKKIAFNWKQCITLLSFIALETFVCPYFKDLIQVTKPLGEWDEDYTIIYILFSPCLYFSVVIVMFFSTLIYHYEKKDTIPLCAVIGAYYIGYYAMYALLNGILILVDVTNLFSLIGDLFIFIGASIKSKFNDDMTL